MISVEIMTTIVAQENSLLEPLPPPAPQSAAEKKAALVPAHKLFSVVPIVFPCHELIRALKNENALLKHGLQKMFWDNHSHTELTKLVLEFGRKEQPCTCQFCYGLFNNRFDYCSCRVLALLKFYMENCGLSVYYMCRPDCTRCIQPETPPADFDESKAHKYLSSVSHERVHIFFPQLGNAYAFTYGRCLWECDDIVGSPELRKLRHLFACIRAHNGYPEQA